MILDLGTHAFELSADGHRTQRKTITISGGDDQTLSIKLLPNRLSRSDESSAPAAALQADDGSVLSEWWFWTAAGVAAVAIAAGAWVVTHPTEKVGDDPETTLGTIGTIQLEASR